MYLPSVDKYSFDASTFKSGRTQGLYLSLLRMVLPWKKSQNSH